MWKRFSSVVVIILLFSFNHVCSANTGINLCESTTDPKGFLKFYDSIKKRDNRNLQKPSIKIRTNKILSDIDRRIPKGKQRDICDFAIIIGNENYKFISNVKYAHNDLRLVKKYIVDAFGINKNNVIEFKDATKGNFELLFGTKEDYKGKVYRWTKENKSRILLYYVGHGAPDIKTGDSYLVPVDADPHYIKNTGYSTNLLFANLNKIQYKNIVVIIDSCFSGVTPSGMIMKDISPAMLRVKKNVFNLRNGLIFTSSKSNQVSAWHSKKGHSLFTYFFLKGLQGDADNNNDNVIDTKEMFLYLKDNVSFTARRLDVEQDPQLFGKENRVLVEFK